MKLPVQITFRGMKLSASVENKIREEATKLNHYNERIIGCRIMVEIPHKHHQKGNLFHIRINLRVPGGEIVVKHMPNVHNKLRRKRIMYQSKRSEVNSPHKDIYIVISDAFDKARKRLQDYTRCHRGDVKTHDWSSRARVAKLFPDKGYGFLETTDGREIYFHQNSVLKESFKLIKTGSEVAFAEVDGAEGPHASTVRLMGKAKVH
jgi:cold shock CspA family protein